MDSSNTLNTFGAVFTFAIELEARLSAYYGGMNDAAMAEAADKRKAEAGTRPPRECGGDHA